MKEMERRKQRWIELMDLNSSVNRILLISHKEHKAMERPPLWWEYAAQREEWAYQVYMEKMEDMEAIPDDSLPYLPMHTGTEIFAEAFGCRVHRPDDNNPFALPLIHSAEEFYKIKKPRLEDTRLVILFDMADHLLARAGKDALMCLPDIQTPVDIAALIWEKSDFYAAMIETPELVKELASMVKELLFEFCDEWFRRYGKEFISHFPDYYMPYGITMSEDEVGAVSSGMYQEFFQQELVEFSARYGAIGIHCCADSLHQWENFKKIPNLKMLNLVRNYEQTLQSLDYFRHVCAQHPSLSINQVDTLPHPEEIHMVQTMSRPTREEAKRIAQYFAEHNTLPEFSRL